MGACCSPREYGRFFNRKQARRDARRYRRRGLDKAAGRIVAAAGPVAGATVLEVGGGVGTLGVELLRAGAERATNVELSAAYEEEASALLREEGLEGRVDRRLGDFVAEADDVEPADVVVMNRVVCCYPDYDALVGAAAGRARRTLVFTYPREEWWMRAGMAAINGFLAVIRCGFRSYVHPAAGMLAAAERRGLRLSSVEPGTIWQLAALERPVASEA